MSSHQRRQLHVNSLLAYFKGEEEMFSKREILVLKTIERLRAATDREVLVALGKPDMNYVRPRISELLKDGTLVELPGKKEDPITGMRVRVVALAADPRAAQRQFELEVVDARRTA